MLDLRGYTPAFSSCGEWGVTLVVVHGILTAGAFLAEHRL